MNISQEKLADYLLEYDVDTMELSVSLEGISPFWAYVAGREHKEKPCPPPTPVKAQWVKHEN